MAESRTWTIVGDRSTDDEWFIPMSPRDFELLRKLQEGPTEEEHAAMLSESKEREAARLSEMRALRERHELLVKFADSPVVSALLEQHAPHEHVVRFGYVIDECHGCPESHDAEYGESYQSWPCPTWQTIANGGETGDK